MINNTSNQTILKLIKYAPFLMVFLLSIVMNALLFQENKYSLQKDIQILSDDFITKQRLLLKNNIDGISREISLEKEMATEQLRDELKERVNEAISIADGIYKNNQQLSKNELGQRIKDALRNVRFNDGRGYYFAASFDGISQLLPLQPQSEGEVLALKDFKGVDVVAQMLALLKEDQEAFHHWWYKKPEHIDIFKKTGFIKRFDSLNWFIGTGEYNLDFEEGIKTKILKKLNARRSTDTTSYYIIDKNSRYIAHNEQSMIGNHNSVDSFSIDKNSNLKQGYFIHRDTKLSFMDGTLSKNIYYALYNHHWKWTIVGNINTNEFQDYFLERKTQLELENEKILLKIMTISGFITLLSLFFSMVISNAISVRFKRYQRDINTNINKLESSKSTLAFWANHDALTKLPNRRFLEQHITNLINEASSQRKMAVVFFDLDDFKKINDHYGHETGDELLVVLSDAFSNVLDEHDRVFRFGGDEFIFCFSNINKTQEIVNKINRLNSIFSEKITLKNNVLNMKGTYGISCFPNDGVTAHELIRKADLALYKGKKDNKGDYTFYENSLDDKLERALLIEKYLREAIKHEEFNMVYQPQICSKTNVIIGVEALIRWNNETLGFVSPDEFIGVAENTGLINQLGHFIIEQSCKDIGNYNLNTSKPINLSINISPEQLTDIDFVKRMCDVAKRNHLLNNYITIEITENVFVAEIDHARAILKLLRENGFDVSLDDFGTGYSSLSYLSQLPMNEIKIDRSFITEFLESDQSLSLVKSIISIGKSCHMNVVAEGVETFEQYNKLKQLDCDIIQGYYFSRPVSIDDLVEKYQSEPALEKE